MMFKTRDIIGIKDIAVLMQFVALEFREQGCNDAAKALTYTSLFAVVPLMTVMYVVLSAVPMFKGTVTEIEQLVFKNFVPATGNEVLSYLHSFSEQAKDLTGIGIFMLAVTAFMMLQSIEKAFNSIWHVKNTRKGLKSFLLYWAVLSLGPLLLGSALAMRTYVLSFSLLVEDIELLGWFEQLFTLLPWCLTAMAFALLYVAVPNCPVPFSAAIIGGLVSTAIFNILKSVFTWGLSASSYQVIYGAFATVPLFLLWTYLSWVVILLGAQLVKGLSSYAYTHDGRKLSDRWLELLILEMFWSKQQEGGVLESKEVLKQLDALGVSNVGLTKWHSILDKFIAERVIIGTDEGGYVLNRDLEEFSVWDVMGRDMDELMSSGLHRCKTNEGKVWCQLLSEHITDAGTYMQGRLAFSIASLFKGVSERTYTKSVESMTSDMSESQS